ncbi:MAG: TatD family hydrolase [Bacteriovoracales bacterium]|nr:TatD family hydrolase [Bacteriovoracales bacterium]
MTFIETHFHLDYLKALPPESIIARAKEAGVERFITISVEPDNFKTVRDLAGRFDDLYCTQGIHPHEASKMTPTALEEVESHGKNFKKCVAIGEIGLDYHYDHSPREKQREVFRKQLDIAARLGLPVVIHSRDADEDTLDILGDFSTSLKRKGVIHSFTSGKKLAEFALEEGFYLGFNGIITFKNAQNVRDIVELTPVSKMLVETDAPFLTPVPHRGKENAPCYIPLIAQKMALIKGMELSVLAPILYENSRSLFFKT